MGLRNSSPRFGLKYSLPRSKLPSCLKYSKEQRHHDISYACISIEKAPDNGLSWAFLNRWSHKQSINCQCNALLDPDIQILDDFTVPVFEVAFHILIRLLDGVGLDQEEVAGC